MKKISHKERIEASKASIKKTKKLESRRMDPKVRKGFSISTGVLATGGIIAGATVGIMAAANSSALATYPTDPKALQAHDFVAGNVNEKPHFDVETTGSQTVIRATEGPVKFISNYKALFDEEKMGDFTNWFYHDVSWGPEIAALSSINFLSGVQSDNGKTTLGYHTTSREGSTIIMSPDVPFDWNKRVHTEQSIAFYIIKNFLQPMADSDPAHSVDNYISSAFPDYAPKKNEPSYVALLRSNNFQNSFLKMYNKSYAMSANLILTNNEVAFDSNGILMGSQRAQPGSLYSPQKGINIINLFRNSLKKISIVLSDPKITSDDKAYYTSLQSELIARLFPDVSFTMQFQFTFLNVLLSSDDNFMDGLTNMNAYQIDDYAGTSVNALAFNALTKKMMALYDESAQGAAFHLRTQDSLVAYETKPEKVKDTLNDLLVTAAVGDKIEKEDKIAAVLSVMNFYYSFNGVVARDIPDGNHNLNYGDSSLQHTYDVLKKMSSSDIDAVDGEWVYSAIFSTEQVGEYSPADILSIKSSFEEFSNDNMTQLSQDMDKRMHPGKTLPNQKRTPGLPIYKSASEREDGVADSFYDSITRRISQDMLYTISHEYGHHTTMWYAQDISSMKNPQSILENDNPTGTLATRGVVPNSQVITLPGLDSYADAGKYYLYKNAFKSTAYKEVLDKTTDGDSQTDMTHQSFRTDFTMGQQIKEVNSDEGGIEGFTLLASAFDPLFLGQTSTTKFGETMEGNGLALDLLQRVVKDGQPKVDPTKTVKENDLIFYKEIKELADKDTSIKTDDDFRNFVKLQIAKSLADSEFFGKDISAYASGQSFDVETKKPLYIKADGKGVTTETTGPDGQKLKEFIGNPHMADEGGTFGWFVSSSLATAESNDVRKVLVKFIQALTTAADDKQHHKSLEDVLSTFAVKDLEMVVGKLSQAIATYSQITKPVSIPNAFIDAIKLYEMVGGDEDQSLSDLVTKLTPYIDKWSLGSIPTADPAFTEKGTASFEGRVFARANRYLDALNAKSTIKLRNVTGEMILRSYYEITGETTRAIFEKVFDATETSKIRGVDGTENDLNTFASTIEEKIALFTPLIASVVVSGGESATFADFQAILHKDIKVNVDNKDYTVSLSDKAIDEIENQFKDGGSVFTFRNGVAGVAAVAYTFTNPKDVETYKHHFTTVTTGSMPPESFYRYTSTYVEGLTRAWNQLAFAVNPELLTAPGEFYDGDPARFASEGESLYNLQSADGVDEADELISDEGKDLTKMYEKYYNTDKTISSMLRDRTTGLYSFLGYTDSGAEHISGLVFTKPNADGKFHQEDFVSEADAIYGVDNYHYYTKHGDASTRTDFTGRESFMTEFSVLGDFENSKLKQGSYKVWKWTDNGAGSHKGDGIVEEDEITPIKNSEIEHNGYMNNNGKSPDTAEIIGNPEDEKPDANFEIKVGDIKV